MPESQTSSAMVSPGIPEDLEIHTIPDKYYGAALKTRIVEEMKVPAPPTDPHVHKSRTAIFVVVIGLLVLIGGGFVYFNRALLFPPPAAPQVVVETPKPVPVPIPNAPTNASATSSNPQSVIVSWSDTADNESGFRIERSQAGGAFTSLTSLPQNSTSFLDASAQPKMAYAYRIRALNVTGESEPSNEATATTPDVPPPPPEAPKLPPAGLDTDSDGLTDLEESLYGTDFHVPDTDGDGFLDGNEVFHLYNPNGRAPARLLDLALIKPVESKIGWVLSIPASWALTFNVADGTRATIDTKHGETFVVTVEENLTKKPVLNWYLDTHPGVTAAQVLQYRSKGGYVGIIGADLLTTYIPWGDKVFVLSYDLHNQTFINYRTTYSMILNSLMLSGLPQVSLPTPGSPLPFEPGATSSGVIAQPIPVSTTTQP